MKVSYKDIILKIGFLCLVLDWALLLWLCFLDSCPVLFQYSFWFCFFSLFFSSPRVFLWSLLPFYLITSCLSSIACDSWESLFHRISAPWARSCNCMHCAVVQQSHLSMVFTWMWQMPACIVSILTWTPHGPALMNVPLETEGCWNGVKLGNLTGNVHTTIPQRHDNITAPNFTCHSLQGDGWLITGTCTAQQYAWLCRS